MSTCYMGHSNNSPLAEQSTEEKKMYHTDNPVTFNSLFSSNLLVKGKEIATRWGRKEAGICTSSLFC